MEEIMASNKKRRFGLGLLPPEIRWAFLFLTGMLFIFINSILWAAVLFALGITLFLANEERNWKLALSAPVSGGMMFLYNTILSPPEYGGLHWFVFTINQVGVERGLVTGLRLTGVMFISFAWLFSTSIPEMYQGIAWLKPSQVWSLGMFRGIQIVKREFVALTQSLLIRGLRWNSLWANIRNLVPLATMIIPRIIENAQKATFALQSHQRAKPIGNGEIEVKDLFTRYSPRLPDVLHGINLDVDPGEFVYLAGKSAAGKTTLLRVMGGVISWVMGEFKGEVIVSGMVTHEIPLATFCGTARYVAPDPFASIYGLTIGQEISFLAEDEKAAKEALRIMGIEDLWERETTKLSGGQQVRLVLAGALASEAKVLLLDAPMQELDPEGRVAFMEALDTLRSQRPCTIVVADPFWHELRDYADRVIVLEKGKLIEDFTAADFFTKKWLSRCNLLAVRKKPLKFTPGDVIAEMDDVYVTLENNKILTGIDFVLREGELVAIMGPNGSGKTTAMLTLAGAIAPVKGKVETIGRVGFVFQNPSLQIGAMTVEEELAFGPKILGWPDNDIDAFVKAGLEWTGLEPLACPLDLHPADMRMLAIAACNPRVSILVLDEPTIGLDTLEVQKVTALVETMVEEGKAIVIITHDEEIARQAHRVVIVDKGQIAFDGPPEKCPLLRPERRGNG